MITKIIVIAMGLVAVIPHGDNDGATVLLRDALLSAPAAKLADGTDCRVGLHVPLVLQAAGTCQGDCISFNVTAATVAQVAPKLSSQPSTGAAGKLFWTPIQQSLQFDGVVPVAEPGLHNFAYSFRLGGGAARVRADCLGVASNCPIVGRFTTGAGGLRACTLSQLQEAGQRKNAGFVVRPFEEEVNVRTGDPLAEAYAIEVDTNRQAPLVLTASNLSEGRVLREASLFPDEQGVIAVVIVNLPLTAGQLHQADACSSLEGGAAHSAVVYDLARGQWGAAARVVPHLADTSTTLTSLAGGCSTYLDLIRSVIPGALEFPSNPAQCKPAGVLME